MSTKFDPCRKHPNHTDTDCVIKGCQLGHLNKYQCDSFRGHVKFFYGVSREELETRYIFNSAEIDYILAYHEDK